MIYFFPPALFPSQIHRFKGDLSNRRILETFYLVKRSSAILIRMAILITQSQLQHIWLSPRDHREGKNPAKIHVREEPAKPLRLSSCNQMYITL